LKQFAPIAPPINVIGVAWAVNDLSIGRDGRVMSATSLKGDDPFRSFVEALTSRWLFEPARTTSPVEGRAAAIFLFRPRTIFPAGQLDLSRMPASGQDRPPVPVSLSDPGYPANSVAEGVVIVELQLTDTGVIDNVLPLNTISGLTIFTAQHVRTWKFEPALSKGVPVRGTVVAGISYLRPLV
jgi:hypothetical protein